MRTQNDRVDYIDKNTVRVLIANTKESPNISIDYIAEYQIHNEGLNVVWHSDGGATPKVPPAAHQAQILVTQCYLDTGSFEALLPTNTILFKGKWVALKKFPGVKFEVLHYWGTDEGVSLLDIETNSLYPSTEGALQPLAGPPPEEAGLPVGTKVIKSGGDYTFDGVVVAEFPKKSGAMRYVVENNEGILHIYSAKNLKRKEPDGKEDSEE